MKSEAELGESAGDVVQQAVIEALKSLANGYAPVDLTTNFVQFEKDLGDSLFHLELQMSLEERLVIRMTNEDWFDFYRSPMSPNSAKTQQTWHDWEREVAPTLTVAAFADFIRERYVSVSFEPVSVLGSPPCPAAGYFVGMSELVQQIRPDTERFGPSTSITQVLPANSLSVFWRRLSRAANRSLPELSFWLNHLANVLLIASAACLMFGVLVNWAFLAAAWLLCLKGILFARWLHRRANPLPRGIVTFGDLSRHLAGQKEIPAPRSLSRRAGAWFGRTFLRRRSAENQVERMT